MAAAEPGFADDDLAFLEAASRPLTAIIRYLIRISG
jgi:hypothetical protein